VPLHIVQRGHNREACFFGKDDDLAYRHWLGEALRESGCALHAYVLMTNPMHLLLTPPQPQDVPRLIISLGRRYVQYINLARSQSQPLGSARSLDTIERVTGHRREAKPRGRPKVERTKGEGPDGQVQIELK
jgi:REP element-mobilizing transposase RayT